MPPLHFDYLRHYAGRKTGPKLSAIVKYHCTHRAQQSIIDAMDIAGGKGIMLGEGNSWRAAIRAHRLPSPLKVPTS